MTDETTGLWPAVRRALGRLVSTTTVRQLSLPELTFPLAVTAPALEAGLAPVAGAAEGRARPAARNAMIPLPQADAGAGGADLSPVALVLAMDAPLRADGVSLRDAALLRDVGIVHHLDITAARAEPLPVRAVPMALTAGDGKRPPVLFFPPEVASLQADPPGLSREARPRWPGRRGRSADLLQLAGGQTRSGAAIIAGVPLIRTRRPAPSAGFPGERRRLAESAGVAEEDVILLGVFPQVPVAAVRRLALSDGGSLSLWLKPEALAAASAGKTPRLATLVIGRSRATGRLIQTVS